MVTAGKAPAKKETAKESAPAKKTAAKKSAPAKKTAGEKAPAAKRTTTKAPAAKKSTSRRYSPAASENVGRELHEMNEGKLTIGRSQKKVTNSKQAIAIGLAEARRAGKKVPPNPNDPKK